MIFQKYLYICSTRMKMYGTVTMHLEYPTYIKASELMFFCIRLGGFGRF